jgi:hypothetical protein
MPPANGRDESSVAAKMAAPPSTPIAAATTMAPIV